MNQLQFSNSPLIPCFIEHPQMAQERDKLYQRVGDFPIKKGEHEMEKEMSFLK